MMGRKQGQPPSSKGMKAKAKKPAEQGRAGKRPLPKSVVTSNSKQMLPKSTAGFSLYSSDSEADIEPTVKPTMSKENVLPKSPRKQSQNKVRAEKQPTEIKSQMQLQRERMMTDSSTGIVVPTGDFEGLDEKTQYESFELPEVHTPFNKRLISSTPDPERLLQAELQEVHRFGDSQGFGPSLPLEISPQLIPERDTVNAVNAPVLIATVASGLSEKLKHQRMLAQHQLKQHQKQIQDPPQVPQFPQPLSKSHQQKAVQHQNLKDLHPQQSSKVIVSKVSQDMPFDPPLPITKAEWVEDFVGQGSNTTEMVPASFHCDHSSKNSSRGLINSAQHQVHHSVSSSQVPPDSHSTTAFPIYQTDNLSSLNLHTGQVPYLDHGVSKPEMSDLQAFINEPQSQVKHIKVQHDNVETSKPAVGKITSNNASNKPTKSDPSSSTASSNSKLEKTEREFSKSRKSAFTSSLSAGKKDHRPPSLEGPSKDLKELAGPNPCDEKIPKQSGPGVSKVNSRRKTASQKDNTAVQGNVKAAPVKDRKKVSQKIDERGEDVPPSIEREQPVMPLKEIPSVVSIQSDKSKPFPDVNPIKVPTYQDLDSSADTCDIEVSNVISDSNNKFGDGKDVPNVGTLPEAGAESNSEDSQSGRSTGLSQVIELLKTGAFNEVSEPAQGDRQADNETETNKDETSDEKLIKSGPRENTMKKEEATSTLEEMMSQYLPKQEVNVTNSNNNNSRGDDDSANELNNRTKSDAKNEDTGNVEGDVNQNYNSRYDRSGNADWRKAQNLRYLEHMADSRLHDIACRLALKATALRDPELRDLIDDMIFHTDAALAHEDARFQSSQMFFAEENGKLKKRVQNINRQLEAKERQERMGGNAIGISNNDVLHLERKIMYLRQEKDKLDSQVTTLLEEKGKWLITQQDLVKTISLKDHEILKLEEKHHEEMKSLHQSLDQAAKNSQGVHYKLSVADREISNLEQRIKTKDLEIGELKDKVMEVEKKHRSCEARSLEKDKEMVRLQDLVDTLKIGVDHVLHAYEASTGAHSTDGQRQGIENLRQMVHPEEYSSSSGTTPSDSWQRKTGRDGVSVPGKTQDHHYSQATTSSKAKTAGNQLLRPRPHYPSIDRPPQLHQRPRQSRESKEVSDFHRRGRSLSAENKNDDTRRLTPQVLEEHNRLLSPVDHSLWRSLDDGPVMPPIAGEEPYFSDSEIEVNHRDSRRRSSRNFPERRFPNDAFYMTKSGRDRLSHGSYPRHLKSTELRGERDYDHTIPKTAYRNDESGRARHTLSDEKLSRRNRERKDDSGRFSGQVDTERGQAISINSKSDGSEELEAVPIEPDEDGDDESRYSVTDYFRQYSSMPPTRSSPRRVSFEDSDPWQDKNAQVESRASQTTKFSTLRSTALSKSNGGPEKNRPEGQSHSTDTKYSTLRSQTISKVQDSREQWDEANWAHEKDFSGLRSKSFSEEGTPERDPQRSTRHIRSFTEQPPRLHGRSHSPVLLSDSDRREKSSIRDTLEYKSLSSSFPSDKARDSRRSIDNPSQEHWQSSSQRHDDNLSPRQNEGHSFDDSRTFPEQETRFTSLRPHHLSGSSHLSKSSGSAGHDYHPHHSFPQCDTENTSHDFYQHHSHRHHSGHQTFPNQYGHHSTQEHEPHRYKDTHRKMNSPRGAPDHQHHKFTEWGRPSVTFQGDQPDESFKNPSYSIQSDFMTGRSSLPTQSSPIHLSDVSISRRATRGTDDQNLTQKEFFQGTELSASLSSISDNGAGLTSFNNNNELQSLDEDPFSSGIASLDAKIIALQKKIDRTKAIFS